MAIVDLLPNSRNLPAQLTISDHPRDGGGEGWIYSTLDGRYIVKIYKNPSSDKADLLQKVIDHGKNLDKEEEQCLAWPLAIVSHLNGQPKVGVVTRQVPQSHIPLYELINSKKDIEGQFRQGRSWFDYLVIARKAAAAVSRVHGKGIAHTDIQPKNFLVNPTSTEVVLIDLDGAAVKDYLPPQVMGVFGFIAPEVLMRTSLPKRETDRHSLAVLILWTLLLRNVMLPQRCYDAADTVNDDILGYGQYACFSENRCDSCNWIEGIGVPFYRDGYLSYRCLTPKLRKLTRRALVTGLHTPKERPVASSWEDALAEAYDVVIVCSYCRQSYLYPYWLPLLSRACPFCGSVIRSPFPSVLDVLETDALGKDHTIRSVVLSQDSFLYTDVIEPYHLPPRDRDSISIEGQIFWDVRAGVYRLFNTGNRAWQIVSGGSGVVVRGASVALTQGLKLSFGAGKRSIRVRE